MEIKEVENSKQEKAPRFGMAILASIGAGLIGAVIYAVLYYIGIIAWIAALAIVFLAGWGYKKFNLKFDKKGYLIVAIISLAEVVVATFITIGIMCAMYDLSFAEVFAIEGFTSALIQDIVLGIVFIAIGLACFIAQDVRNRKVEARKQATEAMLAEEKRVLEEKKAELAELEAERKSTENVAQKSEVVDDDNEDDEDTEDDIEDEE